MKYWSIWPSAISGMFGNVGACRRRQVCPAFCPTMFLLLQPTPTFLGSVQLFSPGLAFFSCLLPIPQSKYRSCHLVKTLPWHVHTSTHLVRITNLAFCLYSLRCLSVLELRAPGPTQSVYREDCTQCFDSIVRTLFIAILFCLHCVG